ncbi:hypothetical protein MN608_07265 [Microdochium nivale]|nr:hypothetical protein MN608_07265 [Microdochium nivale]
MWLWEADHMIELHGTASEHAVFYQYNLHGATNIYAGMLQTESPTTQPPPPNPYLQGGIIENNCYRWMVDPNWCLG